MPWGYYDVFLAEIILDQTNRTCEDFGIRPAAWK